MTQHPLSGVYAAALTPLKSDLSPDTEAVVPFLSFLASRGCDGALIFGTTGEGPSFSPAERETVWRAALKVREQAHDFKLFAGTGTPGLTETIDLTKLAFELGFNAVVTLPPYYFRKVNDEGLFHWFEQVIHKAVPSDGFLFGYHIPSTAGIGLSLELIARLKDSFPTRFAGIKDSSHDETFTRALGEKFGADLTVFNGTDSDFTLALQNHAAGCITALANIISPSLREVYDLFIQGKDTSVAQVRISEQRHLLEKYQPFPPLLKALLPRLHNQPRWPVRPPLVELSKEHEEKVIRELVS
jgi:4-hydroxy-tetrahydrodipicolinate synthase